MITTFAQNLETRFKRETVLLAWVTFLGCSAVGMCVGLVAAGYRFHHPIPVSILAVLAVAAEHGKFAGLGGERDAERQLAFIRKGVRFVTTQTDIGFLMAGASRRTEQIRKALR